MIRGSVRDRDRAHISASGLILFTKNSSGRSLSLRSVMGSGHGEVAFSFITFQNSSLVRYHSVYGRVGLRDARNL